MKAKFEKYTLCFKNPSGTSRGVLTTKDSWLIYLEDDNQKGVGECGVLKGLSIDKEEEIEKKLTFVCQNIHLGKDQLYDELKEFPAIQFGLEQAFLSLQSKNGVLFESDFTSAKKGIPINGLVWMGDENFMKQQIKEKLAQNFTCIKMKIGAIDFETEFKLLKSLRKSFSANEIEIRVDANGAFTFEEALEKLKRLSDLELHSIEQPIKPKQWDKMYELCQKSPLSIALDEELIGVISTQEKKALLDRVSPPYIILKPSLLGGYRHSEEWIALCKERNIGWWVTSALESNIGLMAIAQWTYTLNNPMPQGLGTGGLYTNNFPSPLMVENGFLKMKFPL